jgi:aspartate kinase
LLGHTSVSDKMERKTGFEPATTTLARWGSTGLSYFRLGVNKRCDYIEASTRASTTAPAWERARGWLYSIAIFGSVLRVPTRRVTRTQARKSRASRLPTSYKSILIMPVLVQKYGGTSVADPDRIRDVARRVASAWRNGNDTVVVVSAMGHTTDELIQLAHRVSRHPPARELDMLLTAGERVSMSLLAMALHDLAVEAISFTGSQSGILTDGAHRVARIQAVRPERIRAELARRRVVIVAGFQGVNPDTKEVTTLGRGGSDTTAVALAASLGPSLCEVYTDVSGVYTADPRVVPSARPIPRISYRVCSTLAHLGGRVLHARSVDLAAANKVPLVVRSAFDEFPGTRIEEEDGVEGPKIQAVTHRGDCSIVLAEGNAGGRGEARALIEAVAAAYPEIELIAHEQASDAHAAIVWVGGREEAEALRENFRSLRGPGMEWKLQIEHGVAFVSVVGIGLGATEAARAEEALEKAGVPLVALRITPTAQIFRVPDVRCADAVRAMHRVFFDTPLAKA